jgi:alkylation response protein AidB-like acyl-CoA dehydrogenase
MRQELARLETAYRLGRMLVLREVLGQAPKGFSAATKSFCTEHEQRVADFAARCSGPRRSSGAAPPGRSATDPPTPSWAGPSNILRNILGERLLALPKEPSPR